MPSTPKTALVTGASRGVGKGIAIALNSAGYQVFATGRTIAATHLPPSITRIPCDHTIDSQTSQAFSQIKNSAPTLDLLVNSAWAGYERMLDENGGYTWTLPFWQQPTHRWTSMIDAGLRAAFMCSSHAAEIMVTQRAGLIVNISYWAARKHIANVIYGIAKAATDKMTSDMALELLPFNVSVASLYPGLVRTEAVLQAAQAGWLNLSNSESPEFIGHVIAALAADPSLLSHSGKALIAAALAQQFNIHDTNGRQPAPLTLESA